MPVGRLIVTCPTCRTEWQLTPRESERNSFTCPGCQRLIDLAAERIEDKVAETIASKSLRGSFIAAGVLLALDVLVYGSFLISMVVGPIWLVIAITKAHFGRNWRLSVKRILILLVTLAIVSGNAWLQNQIARRNAELIIKACTNYRADKGTYPDKLDDLVPTYLDSVPRAKYDLLSGAFDYWTYKGQHTLDWVEIPPFGRPTYDFEEARWGFLD